MAIYSGRQTVIFQLRQLRFHGFADLHDIRTARSSYQNADRALLVIEHLVTGWIFIPLFDQGYVAQTQLVVVMALDKHLADVVHRFETIVHRHSDAVVPVIIVTTIGCLVLSVQGSQDFGRFHAKVGHAVLQQGDIDTFGTFPIYIHPVHSFYFDYFPLDRFGIISHLPIGQSIARQCVEHAEHLAEIVLYDRCISSGRKQGGGIVDFPPEKVPMLLHVIVLDGGQQFDLNQGQIIE